MSVGEIIHGEMDIFSNIGHFLTTQDSISCLFSYPRLRVFFALRRAVDPEVGNGEQQPSLTCLSGMWVKVDDSECELSFTGRTGAHTAPASARVDSSFLPLRHQGGALVVPPEPKAAVILPLLKQRQLSPCLWSLGTGLRQAPPRPQAPAL